MGKVSLTKLEEIHLEMVRSWRNSSEVSDYMYTDRQISKKHQKEWFEKVESDQNSFYWIIKYENRPIGLASITNIDDTLKSCYWAFYLGDTSIRGGGIGSFVELFVINYVFNILKLNKLRCEVFTSNDKVIRMHEKFGFRREAFYREHCLKNGEYQDVVGMAILKKDWMRLSKYYEGYGNGN
ncbi:MAG: UDP-4-amino-4,6-dideoxy-N-acetyl-beta-L-altrosamine N-acetyltransferase [Candidatus Marinimicrobia bacterium]|nr:UDP-4-amino-4,6-dideoxy-N-acetyl-beta-L-altrosamine N-acetyltransferase [Candidatus Neomarinimicrobiota bacterium]